MNSQKTSVHHVSQSTNRLFLYLHIIKNNETLLSNRKYSANSQNKEADSEDTKNEKIPQQPITVVITLIVNHKRTSINFQEQTSKMLQANFSTWRGHTVGMCRTLTALWSVVSQLQNHKILLHHHKRDYIACRMQEEKGEGESAEIACWQWWDGNYIVWCK